jgi:hypothetical protein
MKLHMLSGILLLSVILSACQSTAVVTLAPVTSAAAPAEPAKTTGSAAQYQYIFNPPSDPASAAVTLDESKAVEAVVPLEGGVLRATGADGTLYALEIPGDALLNETKIRLIPAAVSGLPFGGEQNYAAQLEPEGLFFNNFVTLIITPSQEIPLNEQLFFGYQEAGKDVIFAPPVVDSKEIKIHILHFSGYGVTKGLLADPESVRERLGGSAERRLQSQTAEILGRERQRQLLGGKDSQPYTLDADLQALFDQYQKEVVDVRIAAAGESCAAGRLALQTALGLERQKQLLGFAEGGMDQFAGLMNTVARVCLKEEYQMCVQDHIIHRMVPVWLGFERQYQLLGAAEDPASIAVIQYARDLTKKCLTFELVFESQATFDDGGGGFDSSVKAKVLLHFQPDTLKINGTSALINDSFTFKVPDCTVISTRGGSTLPVTALVYIPDNHSPNDTLGYVRDFKLFYFPEPTKEVFSVTCPDNPTYTSPPSGLWWGEYLVLHSDELTEDPGASSDAQPAAPAMPDLGAMMADAQSGVNLPSFAVPAVTPGGGYLLTDWEVMGGEYFAKKEWIKEDAGLGLVEVGTFKLYHRPGQ